MIFDDQHKNLLISIFYTRISIRYRDNGPGLRYYQHPGFGIAIPKRHYFQKNKIQLNNELILDSTLLDYLQFFSSKLLRFSEKKKKLNLPKNFI